MACEGLTSQQQSIADSEAHANAMSAISLGERESRLDLSVLKDVIRRLSATPGSRNVILVSPGFYLTSEMRTEEAELLDRAIRANVTLSSLDVRGVYTVIPGGDASQTGRMTAAATNLLMLMQQNSMSADSDVMAELADATGGQFFHNDNGLFEGFRQLVAQPEYIYILGFSPQNLKLDGARHALKVALKNPKGFDLQARSAYYAPNHAVNLEQQAKEEIQEAVFSRDEIQDLPVDLNLQYARAGGVMVKLNVLAKVNIKQLRFRKADERNFNTLTVVSSVFDRNGNFVAGIERIVELRLRDQTLGFPHLRHHRRRLRARSDAGKLSGAAGGAGFGRADHVGPQRRGRDSVLGGVLCTSSTPGGFRSRALPDGQHIACSNFKE